jgi:hypothetical protein
MMHDVALNWLNSLVLEQRTVKDSRFVLASLSANIELELVPLPEKHDKQVQSYQGYEIGVELRDSLSEVLRLETHGADLHELSIHLALDHFLKQLRLISEPEIGQRHQPKPLTYVFNSEPLII